MNRLAQWLNDKRWAANMRRARRWRRGLSSQAARDEFDRCFVTGAGPGAMYEITIDNLLAAMLASHKVAMREREKNRQ